MQVVSCGRDGDFRDHFDRLHIVETKQRSQKDLFTSCGAGGNRLHGLVRVGVTEMQVACGRDGVVSKTRTSD